jgi:2-hydroxychromene-2-carboxylate isomerase
MVAAQRMGRFWDYWLAVCRVEARFDPPIMVKIADSLGMKTDRLKMLIEDPATAAVVDSCMAEGIKNGVTIAPTFFINHIRYKSYKDPQWLIDAAIYKYEETVPSR